MDNFKNKYQQFFQLKFLQIIMNCLRGIILILVFLAIGKLFASYLPFVFPGSIIGLLLLFISLSIGLIKIDWILLPGNFIIKHMAILFIPIGVGLINHLQIIYDNWLVIVFSSIFTTILILFFVGHVFQYLNKAKNKDKEL